MLLDGVFNHVGRSHPWWRAAVEAGPGSAAAARFATGPGARTVDGLPVQVFEGHESLVVLDHDNPEVASAVSDVMAHWLQRGVDGWRLDAAYAVPAAFWRTTIGPLREQFPGAWFVGEVIHGDYVAYVEESGLDSLTQYELWKAIRNSIEERNWFELAWSLQRHDEFAAAFLPLTFLGNHDVTRVASAITDPRHLSHAVAVLFFVAGAPVVYSGDERGLTGTKEDREGGDDAVRPEFPRSPTDWPRTEVFHRYQEVISFRRRHPWLARAQRHRDGAEQRGGAPDRHRRGRRARHTGAQPLGRGRVPRRSAGPGALLGAHARVAAARGLAAAGAGAGRQVGAHLVGGAVQVVAGEAAGAREQPGRGSPDDERREDVVLPGGKGHPLQCGAQVLEVVVEATGRGSFDGHEESLQPGHRSGAPMSSYPRARLGKRARPPGSSLARSCGSRHPLTPGNELGCSTSPSLATRPGSRR